MLKTESTVRVRYAETDAMGIAYHGSYAVWLDVARTEMLTQLGIPYKELERQGLFLGVSKLEIAYKKPAHFDDLLKIVVMVKEKPKVRLGIHYQIERGADLIASAYTELFCADKNGSPTRPSEAFLGLFADRFFFEHSA